MPGHHLPGPGHDLQQLPSHPHLTSDESGEVMWVLLVAMCDRPALADSQ